MFQHKLLTSHMCANLFGLLRSSTAGAVAPQLLEGVR